MTREECVRHLQAAKVKVTGGSDTEIYCLCPLHRDSRSSMAVNPIKEVWICYRGCGKGRLSELWDRLGYEAVETYNDDVEVRIEEEPQAPSIKQFSALKPGHIELIEYAKSRGVSYDTLKLFTTYTNEYKSFIFPVLSVSGGVLGYLEQVPGNKAMAHGKVKNALYGLYQSMYACSTPLVIVEGPFDAFKVAQAGLCVGALMGSSMSDTQCREVLSVSDNIVVMTDSDAVGRKAAISASVMFLNCGVVPRIVDWGFERKKDPGDLSSEKILKYVHNAQSVLELIGNELNSYDY